MPPAPLFVTGKIGLAGTLATVEVITKIALYYFHERWFDVRLLCRYRKWGSPYLLRVPINDTGFETQHNAERTQVADIRVQHRKVGCPSRAGYSDPPSEAAERASAALAVVASGLTPALAKID